MRIDVPADAGPEEVAAIVAAVELTWPRAAAAPPPSAPPAWRFSGRWWRVAPRAWPVAIIPERDRPI
ncbi:MAG: hypothetical protein AAGA99_16695 [Actinomycetota bacterium]